MKTDLPTLVVHVDDDSPIRQDTMSDDMNRIHPEIKYLRTHTQRMQHIIECDIKAYNEISHLFPELRPPILQCIGRLIQIEDG